MATIKQIRKLTNLTQKDFAERYNIPKRTLEDWERGVRTCPEYVTQLLDRCVKMDTCIRRIDFEVCVSNSDGEPVKGTERDVSVIYNTQILSDEEAEYLINNGMYNYDKRMITTIPETADILKIRKE